jgi:MFS transporter, ACS family, hexuronate transporter
VVATVFGIIAAGSGLGGILSTQIVGQLVSAGSFDTVFVLMATLHPVSCVMAWIAMRQPSRL